MRRDLRQIFMLHLDAVLRDHLPDHTLLGAERDGYLFAGDPVNSWYPLLYIRVAVPDRFTIESGLGHELELPAVEIRDTLPTRISEPGVLLDATAYPGIPGDGWLTLSGPEQEQIRDTVEETVKLYREQILPRLLELARG